MALQVKVPDLADGEVTVRVDGDEPQTFQVADHAVAVKTKAEADRVAQMLGGTVEGKP